MRKLFLTKQVADCSRILILSRHNSFYRFMKMLPVSENDLTNQKEDKFNLKSHNKWFCQL